MIQSGRAPAAMRLLRDVLRHRPDNFDALHLLGAARVAGGRPEEGIRDLIRASEIRPEAPAVWVNLASALERVGRLGEAIAAYEKAADLVPDADEANHRLCLALSAAGRLEEAHARAEAFATRRASSDLAHLTLGLALTRRGRLQEASNSFETARQLKPGNILATVNLAFVLGSLRRYEEALPLLAAVVAARPNDWEALDRLIQAKRFVFDWEGLEALEQRLIAAVDREQVPAAVALLSISDRPDLLLRTAGFRARAAMPQLPEPLRPAVVYGHDRIRLGYISGDFRDHPVAQSVAGLIDAHDRQRFEVIGVSLAPDDGSAVRRRLESGFDRFTDVAQQSARQIAHLVRDLEIDIAIDLSGITEFGAPDVLAHRPAPVQVSYLGFPGTIGAPWFDYLIADQQVVPSSLDKHYSEAIVRLPGCFFPPSKRPSGGRTTSRAEHDLPLSAFVFASFNNSFKLSPRTFASWMRIMAATPDSVLWMRSSGDAPDGRLRAAAAEHGVSPERLIFAKRVPEEADHFARLALADLFLDCTPYGAHSTASDALWAGLPVLTAPGQSFASRVAASMLTASGVTELIARDATEYESLALALSRDRDRLAAIRSKLVAARETSPLFNLDLYRRHIEAAYTVMYERARQGRPAAPIEVAPLAV
jgi:predicted O-linked N-acetylglucosamine transferase (SPINDLY family)